MIYKETVALKRVHLLCLLCLLTLAMPAKAQSVVSAVPGLGPPLSSALVAEVDGVVQAQMRRQNIPGLSLAVVVHNQVVLARGYGLADVEHSVPATQQTVYQWASLSKPITAIAVMQLVEGGKINLNAPIQTYVPQFPAKPWPVTPRELLGHLGGIRHYQKGDYEACLAPRRDRVTLTLGIFSHDPLVAEPDTLFHYSSFGFNLLGAAIEGATGQTYQDYVCSHVLHPAGLDGVQIDDGVPAPHQAKTYRVSAQGVVPMPPYDVANKIPSAGFRSDVLDLARFGIAAQNGVLVSPQTQEQMWTTQTTRAGQPTGYGLGWFVRTNQAGRRVVWHGGNNDGVTTSLLMQPDQQCAVAVMCNLNQARLTPITGQIMDMIVLKLVLPQAHR